MIFGSSKFRNAKTVDLNDEDVRFVQTLQEQLQAEGASEVNIADCTYFGWVTAYVFSPYYDAGDAYDVVGCEWTRAEWYY